MARDCHCCFGKPRRQNERGSMSIWTPDMDARLLRWIDGGASFSRTAVALGVSRNQVAGRLFRLSGKHLDYQRPARPAKTERAA